VKLILKSALYSYYINIYQIKPLSFYITIDIYVCEVFINYCKKFLAEKTYITLKKQEVMIIVVFYLK